MPGCGFYSGTPKSVLDALAFSGDWFKFRGMPFLFCLGADTRLPATKYGRCVPPTQPSPFMSPISCSCLSLYLLTLSSEPFVCLFLTGIVSHVHCNPLIFQVMLFATAACSQIAFICLPKHVKLSCLWAIFFPKAFAMTDITYSFIPVKPKWQRWKHVFIPPSCTRSSH